VPQTPFLVLLFFDQGNIKLTAFLCCLRWDTEQNSTGESFSPKRSGGLIKTKFKHFKLSVLSQIPVFSFRSVSQYFIRYVLFPSILSFIMICLEKVLNKSVYIYKFK